MWTNYFMIHVLAFFPGSHAPTAFNTPTFHTAGDKSWGCESLETRLRRKGIGRGTLSRKQKSWHFNVLLLVHTATCMWIVSYTKLNSGLLPWCLIDKTRFFKSTHLHLPQSLIQCFSHMDMLAKLFIYTWLHGSRLREHNKICVGVDTYMGVCELLDNIA